MTTRPHSYTVQFFDRRIAHAEWTDGPPRIEVSGDTLSVGWRDSVGLWRERQLQPSEELVVEHVSRRLYTLSILAPDDGSGGRVEYESDTRPRSTRIRDSQWWRINLTDSIYGRRHVAYLRGGDGVVIE